MPIKKADIIKWRSEGSSNTFVGHRAENSFDLSKIRNHNEVRDDIVFHLIYLYILSRYCVSFIKEYP